MDPVSILSIVSACTNLGFKCASLVHALHTAVERFKSAELSILSLVEECSTIQLAWDHIQRWIQAELEGVPDQQAMLERIQRSLYAGEVVISALQQDLESALSVPVKSGFLQRTKVVWKDQTLKDHQYRIRGQVAALTLLLQVIRLPRQPERQQLLSVKARVFDDSDASAYSIVPSVRAGSISSRASSSTEDSEELRYVPFDFDDSLFTSWVYKRNFRTPLVEQVTQNRFPLGRHRSQKSQETLQQQDSRPVPGSLVGDDQSVVDSQYSGSTDMASLTTDSGSSSQGSQIGKPTPTSPRAPPLTGYDRKSIVSSKNDIDGDQPESLTKLFEVMGYTDGQRRSKQAARKGDKT
ncbi:hypothetical protein K490DRAFT_65319 [Saccharata proteae CBS 121410]|uniref:Fungal N-terminal domain-containing protein n=1 Tax=Saccharata proteae CBS 121410 TaxID=1314787 RepID=A0A9P4HWG7_9PEZI|nr:hypothetical protein K490DRAFT_65319 [Saccharata proteae CBS 121410]